MTEEEIVFIENRVSAASEGPWHACGANDGKCVCGLVWSKPLDLVVATATKDAIDAVYTDEQMNANAAFIAHAREDVPRLVAALRASNADADRLREENNRAVKSIGLSVICGPKELAEMAKGYKAERDALKAEVERLREEHTKALDTIRDLSANAEPSAFKTMLQVDALKAELERQREHNKLLDGALRDERARRKEVQEACERLRAALESIVDLATIETEQVTDIALRALGTKGGRET